MLAPTADDLIWKIDTTSISHIGDARYIEMGHPDCMSVSATIEAMLTDRESIRQKGMEKVLVLVGAPDIGLIRVRALVI